MQELFPEPDLDARSFSRLHRIVLGITHEPFESVLRLARPTIDQKDSSGRSALYWTARFADLHRLSAVLQSGADPNTRNLYGSTALHIAAHHGNTACVEALINAGADPLSTSRQRYTPLHHAAREGWNDIVHLLLDANAVVNAQDVSLWTPLHEAVWTPLHKAVRPDRHYVVEQLVHQGADIELTTVDGWTAILLSVEGNAHISMELLLTKGARCDVVVKRGSTILHIAAGRADAWTMAILERQGIRGVCREARDDCGYTAEETFQWRIEEGDVSDELVKAFRALMLSVHQDEANTYHDAVEEL